MPLYKVEVFKRLGGENWSNSYIVTASSMAAAIPLGTPFVDAERSFHSTQVAFTNLRVSSVAVTDDEFANVPLTVNGQSAASNTGGLLPLWNVVKMYANRGYARPYYKLYRGVIGEANSDNGIVDTNTQTLIEGAMGGLITSTTPVWVTLENVAIASVDVDQFVRHRQLHRIRRVRTTTQLATPE